jgi:N-acetylglucosamine-6-phosphate deacetylase
MLALTNCDVFSGDEVFHDKAVIVEGNSIVDLIPMGEIPSSFETVDLGGASVTPGFVDLQVNGGGDRLFNDDPSEETIEAIVAAHRRFGTTDLLPTFITGPEEMMAKAIAAVSSCLERGVAGVLGIHLEGPFLNPEKAGVHDPRYMRRMASEDLRLLPSFASDGIALLTVAPEMVDAGVIAAAVSRGVKVSAGHSNAFFDQMLEAFGEGLDCGTHLFNAMRNIESREPGVVGAILQEDRVRCGVIADGFHVHPASLRIAWRAGGPGRTFLVTDAMPPVGGERMEFRIGGYEAEVVDGRCQTRDGVLAGSALDMASAVRTTVQRVGVPKDEALRMASLYPAEYIGVDDRLGRIAPGYRANLAFIDTEMHVLGVMVGGEIEWNSPRRTSADAQGS